MDELIESIFGPPVRPESTMFLPEPRASELTRWQSIEDAAYPDRNGHYPFSYGHPKE